MMAFTLWLLLQDPKTLVCKTVEKGPAVDGKADDDAWKDAPELKAVCARASLPGKDKITCGMKCVKTADEIFFLFWWDDKSKDDVHRPYEWFEGGKKYIQKDEILEDEFSIGFPLKGDFTGDMYSAVEAQWDVWYWGADRTSKGLCYDMSHTYTLKQPAKGVGKKYTARDGSNKDLWIIRDHDKGKPVSAKTTVPKAKADDRIPGYVAQEPAGSAADVKAVGAWKDNVWTLEISRKLSTGNADDWAFTNKADCPFALAIFNKDQDAEHRVSDKLTLKLK